MAVGLPPPAHARLFVAIAVPAAVREEMQTAQAALQRVTAGSGVRWTPPEQFHLTLRFLGHVDTERIGQLVEVLRGACAGFPPLGVRAEGIGFFPTARRPKVAWAGVKDVGNQLEALQQTVQAATADFTAEAPETRFSGHITLGRLKQLHPGAARALAQAAAGLGGRVFGEWTASAVELVQSQLGATGATHVCRASLPLAGFMPEKAR